MLYCNQAKIEYNNISEKLIFVPSGRKRATRSIPVGKKRTTPPSKRRKPSAKWRKTNVALGVLLETMPLGATYDRNPRGALAPGNTIVPPFCTTGKEKRIVEPVRGHGSGRSSPLGGSAAQTSEFMAYQGLWAAVLRPPCIGPAT